MTKILKSPFKHKDNDITAHPDPGMSSGYNIARYHEANPETSTATLKANKKKEKEEKERKEKEEKKKKEALVLTDPSEEIQIVEKPVATLEEEEIIGDFDSADKVYNPEKDYTSDAQREYKLNSKVTKSFGRSGVGTKELPLIVNTPKAPVLVDGSYVEQKVDPLKPSGSFYKLNDDWYSDADSNNQYPITNPSHISYLEEQLSSTNKLELEELPSEYFDLESMKYAKRPPSADGSDGGEQNAIEDYNLSESIEAFHKSDDYMDFTKSYDARKNRGGYYSYDELVDLVPVDGNIEKETATKLNSAHKNQLYEGGYVSFKHTRGDGKDVLIMTRVEKEEILKYSPNATEKQIQFLAQNPQTGMKTTTERVYLPSSWNDSGDQTGMNDFHNKYAKLIKPSATEEERKKESVAMIMEFQDINWASFYNPENRFTMKDGKFESLSKDQQDILFSEFKSSIKVKTKESENTDGNSPYYGRKIKKETRGLVTKVTTKSIRRGTSVYNIPATTYTGPQGWDEQKLKKYYAKLKVMDESAEIAEQVFAANLLKSQADKDIVASDDYIQVSELDAELTMEVDQALTTEEAETLTKDMVAEPVSPQVIEEYIDYKNKENKEQQDILQDKFAVHSEETRVKFELDYNEGANKILTDNPGYLDVLDEEFKGRKEEVLSKFSEINTKYQNISQTQYDLIYQKRLKELQDEIRNGQHTGLNNNELSKELNKRINAEHEGVIQDLEKRMMAEKIAISKPLNEEMNAREQELVDEVLGPYTEEAAARYNDVMLKLSSDFYEESMANGNIGNYEIDDNVFEGLMSGVMESGYSKRGVTHELQDKMLGHHWSLYKKTLEDQGKSKREIQDIKTEFVHRVADRTTFGQSGLTEKAIRTMADDAIAKLKDKDNLSDGEEKMLEEALKIKNIPQNMSEWGVINFVNGFSYAAMKAKGLNWIPIASDVIKWSEQKEVTRLSNIQEKDRTADETRALSMYHHRGVMEGKLNELSTVFNVGEGSLETVKFMLELVATRGLSTSLSKSVQLGLSSKLALANTRTLARYRRVKGISKGTIKSKIAINQAAAKTFSFLSHAIVPTVTTGVGKIGLQYELAQTPEMAFAMTNEGGDIIAKLDVYNEQWLEDNAPDKQYITVDGKKTKNPNYNPDFDMDAAERGDPFIELMRASGHVYTDYVTERFGMLLPYAGKYLKTDIMKNPDWLKRVFLARMMKKLNIPPGSVNAFQKLMKAGGYNGMAGEVFEEIVALPIHNLLDGNDLGQGLDAKFFKEVGLQTAIFQGVFSVGGKMYTVATGKKDPSYMVGEDHWRSPEDVIEAAKVAKRDQVDKEFIEVDGKQVENPNYDPSFKFQIDNDISTLLEVQEILEGTTIEAESSNFDIEVNDLKTATEIERGQTMNEEDIKEVEKTTTEIQEKEKQEQDILEQIEKKKFVLSKEEKNSLFEKAKKLRGEIVNLKQFRNDIVTPTIELINNERAKPMYDKILKNVVKIAAMVNPDLQVIEVGSTQEMRDIFLDDTRSDVLSQYGISSLIDAKTGKTIYFDSETNLTLSKNDIDLIVKPESVGTGAFKSGLDQIENEIQKRTDDFKSTHGFTAETGKYKNILFINKEAALNLNASNVAAHEFLHKFLNKTFGQNPHTKLAVGRALRNELMQMNVNGIKNSDFKRRIATYQADQGEIISAEETLNLFSDALVKGEIVYNETRFTKIGDMFRRTFSSMGKRVTFDSGRDVFNFIRDYNRAIDKDGKLSRGMIKTMKKGAKLKGEIKWGSDAYAKYLDKAGYKQDDSGKFPMLSKEASDQVQKIYEEKGMKGAMEIIDLFKPITNKIVEKRRQAPKFDKQLLTDEIETGKRGIYDLIGEYNLKKGIPLAAYINKFLPARAIEASREILGEEFEQDISEMVDIAVDEVVEKKETKSKDKPRDLTSLANLYLVSTPIIVKNKIQILIDQNPKDLEQQITKLIKGEVTKAIQAQMGTISLKKGKVEVSDKYKAFMALNYKDIVQGFDITTIKNNYKTLFELTKIGTESKITKKKDKPSLKKDSYYEKGIYEIVTNKAKFTKFFVDETSLDKDGKPLSPASHNNKIRDRQKKLAGHIAEAITANIVNDQIINLSENNDVVVKAELKSLMDSINRQKKELKGNYNDILRYSKEANDQQSELVMKTRQSEFPDQVWNMDKSSELYGTPLNPRVDSQGKTVPWIPEITKKIFALVEDRKIISEKFKNKLYEKLMRGDQIQDDKSVGDVIEKYFYGSFLDAGLIVPGFTLGETDMIIQPFHTFEGGVFQKPDLLVPTPDGREFGFELKAFGLAKLGHNKPFSVNPKNPEYKYTKDGFELNPNNPDFVNDALRKSFNKVSVAAGKLGRYLKTEFDIDFENRQDFIPFNKDGRIVYNDQVVKDLKAAAGNKDVQVDERFVAHHYNKKGVFYIHIADLGTFYLGSDPLGLEEKLGITKFKGDFDLQGRLLAVSKKKIINGVKKKIGYNLSVDSEAILDPRKVTSKVGFSLDNPGAIDQLKEALNNLDVLYSKEASNESKIVSNAIEISRTVNPSMGITVLDFDDTLATSKSNVLYVAPDGTKGKLTAEQFAKQGADLLEQGYVYDFSEFSKVVKGKTASLFNKAIKLQGKFGPENMFVLTARPADSAESIFEFLQANGLNIPLKNITGLGNSTSEAKALWIAEKVGEGYNDFYFADDALQNVQAVKNMLDQFDVKSKVQQAKIQFSKEASNEFNDILENTTGIESEKVFSDIQAKIRGQKTKYKSIIPASAQDFGGLIYNFLGKGKKGEQDMAFFKKALIDPFARAINELNSARQSSANDYKNLLKKFPEIKKILNKKIEGTSFTNDQAIRVYLWNKAGFEVPGLSKRDLEILVKHVEKNNKLQNFSDVLGTISKKPEGYSKPGEYWIVENIGSDLLSDGAIGDARSKHLEEWQQNVDQIFSIKNLNKIEAIYGSKFREALEDVLYRMKTGRNRPMGGGRLVNQYMNWVNNSVGAIMFFNMRSAVLQTISATNYINWSFNNPAKAAAAFANQPQYWKDFSMIFNSDYLKQRRAGNQRGINEAELSAAVAGSENKAKAAIAWLLKKGFLPTQIADSFAIASGGATFFRNRVKFLVKNGMTQKQAEEQAFLDFQEKTEVSQQSARPDMISQQQASPLGRLILSFQNTPMQYARIMNKAARDLVNGRGDYKEHISKIAYYGVVQSIIFGSLQSAIFAAIGDEDEEEIDKKKERILNGMIDSWLSGIGYGGKAVSTVKNTVREYLKQRDKGFMSDHTYTILQLLSFSPPIGSKARKIYGSIQTEKFNKDVFGKRGFTLDNPVWSGIGNVIEGVTNIPLGRLSQKMLNLDNAMDSNNEFWKRVALVLGWNTWDLGIKDPDIEAVKVEIKEEKKVESKKKAEIKKEIKKKEKEEEKKDLIKENIKKQEQEKKDGKKDIKCAAISKSGNRCKTTIEPGQSYCTIHEKVKQNESGKKVQCKKMKQISKNKTKQCGMMTSSKSGFCYYHD